MNDLRKMPSSADFEIIDAHTHPFLNREESCIGAYGKPETMEEFDREMKKVGIGRYAGAPLVRHFVTDFREIRELNDTALRIRDRFPDYIPGMQVHGGFPAESIAEIERCRREGVRYIGELVPYIMHTGDFNSPGMLEIFRAAGELKMTVRYSLTDDNELVIDYRGMTNKKTIVNMTNHGFFSLSGIANPTPEATNVVLRINADFYVPIDDTSIPTGEIRKVEGTPFDFRTAKPVGQDIDADDEQIKNGAGYDHCFVLNKKEPGELTLAAEMTEPVTGRTMEVWTTEPGVQFYSDNWATGYPGQHGATFPRRSGLCFEAQHFPDSPHRAYFPSVVLRPGELYTQKTIYKFGTDK